MNDFKHSYTRRSHSHDYYSQCAYHIILKKADRCPAFSVITGDARIQPGQLGSANVEWSPLGRIIADAIHNLPNDFPIIAMYCYCVMPDHVHILLRVKERSNYHLGYYISKLTGRITNKYIEKTKQQISHTDIFQLNYTDKIIYANRSLDGLFRYIRENPHRLAMRRQYPQFFQRSRSIQIDERQFEAYGNLFLLRNPDKEAVKISRKDTPEAVAEKAARWLDGASHGTVLVSPFISPKEKEIRAKAENQEAAVILITHEAFPERFKPADHDFALCAAGRLLILSLGLPAKTPLYREICQQMNSLAAEIAKNC